MTQKEAIRDYSGKILGWVETDSRGNKILREFCKHPLLTGICAGGIIKKKEARL